MFRDTLIVYADGTPRTQHVVTNVVIEADEQAGAAVYVSRHLRQAAAPR